MQGVWFGSVTQSEALGRERGREEKGSVAEPLVTADHILEMDLFPVMRGEWRVRRAGAHGRRGCSLSFGGCRAGTDGD